MFEKMKIIAQDQEQITPKFQRKILVLICGMEN